VLFTAPWRSLGNELRSLMEPRDGYASIRDDGRQWPPGDVRHSIRLCARGPERDLGPIPAELHVHAEPNAGDVCGTVCRERTIPQFRRAVGSAPPGAARVRYERDDDSAQRGWYAYGHRRQRELRHR